MSTDRDSASTEQDTPIPPHLVGLLFRQAQELQRRRERQHVRPQDDGEWLQLQVQAETIRQTMNERRETLTFSLDINWNLQQCAQSRNGPTRSAQ